MRYEVSFRGRWQGPLLHALADLDPVWDAERRETVVSVADHAALIAVINRADEMGLTVLEVRHLDQAV